MDSNIMKIVEELAVEFNLPAEVVRHCMKTASISLREQMKEIEYPSILWPRLGTFTINPNRMIEGEEKEQYKMYKADFKKKPYRGVKRHSPIKEPVKSDLVHNEEILDRVLKGLEELEMLQTQNKLNN